MVRRVRRPQAVELPRLHHDVALRVTQRGHEDVAQRIGDGEPFGIVRSRGVLEGALRRDEQLGELSAQLDGRVVAALDARLLPLHGDAEQEVRGEDQPERDGGDGGGEAQLLAELEPVDCAGDPADHSRTLTTFTPLRSAVGDTYAMPPTEPRTSSSVSVSVSSSGGKLRPA